MGLLSRFFQKNNVPEPSTSFDKPLPPPSSDIVQLVHNGKKIAAIQRYRQLHNCDLQAATQIINSIEKDQH